VRVIQTVRDYIEIGKGSFLEFLYRLLIRAPVAESRSS
jgi:hypothetical protein